MSSRGCIPITLAAGSASEPSKGAGAAIAAPLLLFLAPGSQAPGDSYLRPGVIFRMFLTIMLRGVN
jgi:hypothetical protein